MPWTMKKLFLDTSNPLRSPYHNNFPLPFSKKMLYFISYLCIIYKNVYKYVTCIYILNIVIVYLYYI